MPSDPAIRTPPHSNGRERKAESAPCGPHLPSLRQRFRQFLPGALFSLSLLTHGLVFLLFMNVVWWKRLPPVQDLIVYLRIREEEKPPPPPPIPESPLEEIRDIVVPERNEETVPEPKPEEKPEPKPEEKPQPPAKFSKEDPVVLAQFGILETPAATEVIGLKPQASGGQETPKFNLFQGRSGEGKRSALQRGGGSEASENAVSLGLAWLARHQNRAGAWSTWLFEEQCPAGDRCSGVGTNTRNFDPAMTGLALLCFLGGNHTHQEGDYRDTVYRGLQFLLASQKEDGGFGQKHSHVMYNHGIAALALAEAYAMTRDEALKEPLRRAILFIHTSQQASGGWDYTTASTGRSDTSITGWMVMTLKSAAAADIAIPWVTLFGAIQHFDQMTQSSGEVIYANRDLGQGRKGVGMVAVGMLCREFLGWPRTDPVFERQARLILQELPSWKALSTMSFNTMYYWYYATLALYQHGGDAWKVWNANLRDMLCERQRRGGHAHGSWDPDDRWFGAVGGRVYSTTLAILNLEVYYRYLPIYQEGGGGFHTDEILLEAFRHGNTQDRLQAIKLLTQFGADALSNVLRDALEDEDVFIRAFAAEELLRQGDQAGVPALTAMLEHPNGFIRSKAIGLLSQVRDPWLVPGLAKALQDDQVFVSEKAASLLVKITGQDFNFLAAESPARKQEIVERYLEWASQHVPNAAFPGAARPAPSDARSLQGKVLAVKPDVRLVMLDLGRKHGLRKKTQFYVYRRGEFVGAVEVTKILDAEMSSARVLEAFTVREILEGDEVVSRLE
ncbi:MAG: HEAT repeat domain-containing protein [Planctomycetes bacterium]|nr:HEAT repeat domain-containing protein [Planctomycetota bacterium]